MHNQRTSSFGGFVALLILCMGAVAQGCGEALSNASPTPEALAGAVLDALGAKDGDAMEALLITREEHRDLLWDQLPESNTFPFEYARRVNELNTRKGVRNAISRFGGQEFELVSIEFTEPPEKYEGFTVYFGPKLIVRRVSDGKEGELPVLDVVVEYDGRWKLLNYDEL